MKRPSSRTTFAVVTIAVLGLTAACSDDDNASTETSAGATAASGASSTAATSIASTDATAVSAAPATTSGPASSEAPAASGATSEATLGTVETDLGTILVDGEGRTLYAFVPDAQGPSTCTDDCVGAWPSFTGPAEPAEGVDAALMATAARSDDGTEQVTYNDWPLYYFANDSAPGDVNGQGVGDVWFVVGVDGNAISDVPQDGATTTT